MIVSHSHELDGYLKPIETYTCAYDKNFYKK